MDFDFKEKHSYHLCETWQTGSFPRLHSFDELFKSQSRDSLLHCNGQNLSLKMGNTYSQTVFALFYRFTMAPSPCAIGNRQSSKTGHVT